MVGMPAQSRRPRRQHARGKTASGKVLSFGRRRLTLEGLESRLLLAASPLRITELMYHPSAVTAAETSAGFSNSDFEFIEIQNTGAATVSLASVSLASAVTFTFPANIPGTATPFTLAAGQYVVVAANETAFAVRHPSFGGIVAGAYSGSLTNTNGELVRLNAADTTLIQEFTYSVTWLAITNSDAEGFSLTVRDPAQALTQWDTSDGWQASAAPGGSPGYSDGLPAPGSIVINEALAHSDEVYGDAVELRNVSSAAINVGGWLLSDNSANLLKYQIAAGTVIPAGGYLVLTQAANFGIGSGDPGSAAGFGLSEYGFDLYLSSSALVGGSTVAGGYREHVDFSATPIGRPTGLYTKSTGGTDFTLLATPTFGEPTGSTYPGATNSVPYQSPLVVNEIMYHPPAATAAEMAAGYVTQDFEYVEIYNRSGAAIALHPDPYLNLNESRYDLTGGIGFTFGWLPADLAGGVVAAAFTQEVGAAATWNASGLGSAAYDVYATFKLNDPLGVRRNLDGAAQYTIGYAGGSATVTIDQDATAGFQLDADSTLWVPLGSFLFNNVGSVTLTRSAQAGPAEQTIAGKIVFRRAAQADNVVSTPTVASPFMQSGITSIPAGGCLVAASNAAAFNLRYNNGDNHIVVAGTYTGRLKDSGDSVDLTEHMTPDADSGNGYIPRLELEHISYSNSGNWPPAADGQGPALQRIYAEGYCNDAANWLAHAGQATPGEVNVMLLSYDTPDAQHVRLFFSEPLTAASAEAPGNYAMVNATVSSAELDVGGAMVTLSLSNPMFAGLQYPLSISNLATVSGNPAPSPIQMSVAYPTNDLAPPSAAITAVSPNPRAAPLSSLAVVFSEAVLGFNLADLALRYNGGANLLTPAQTLTSSDNIHWTLGNLSGLTAAAGDYALTLTAAGSGISDAAGNLLASGATTAWLTDTIAPSAAITAISPNPRATAVGSLTIVFSKAVSGFDLADLALRRDGGGNLLTPSQTLTSSDNLTWTLENLSGLTAVAGNYALTLTATGSGIVDAPGNALSSDAATTWGMDPDAPTATVTAVSPNPRAAAVGSLTIVFSEAVSGFDLTDLALRRDGGANLLTPSQTLTSGDSIAWTLGNVGGLTAAAGNYALSLTAAGSGITDVVSHALAGDAATTWLTDPVAPTAAVSGTPPAISAAAANASTTTVTVTYADNGVGIDASSLGAADLSVSQGATVTSFSANGNVVQYTISAPAGVWGGSSQGIYTIGLFADQVRDLVGNYAAADANLASFIVDTVAPTAAVSTPPPAITAAAAGNSTTTITVTYADSGAGVDASSIGAANLTIDQGATVTGVSASGNVATYTITSPAGTWENSHQGTYTIGLAANQVKDLVGNYVAANASLASFLVDTRIPGASVTAAPPTITAVLAGANSTTLTVTYADTGLGIDTGSFSTTNLTVDHGATVSGISISGNAVTYAITAPAATWGSSPQGIYTIALVAQQVKNLSGTYVAANDSLASFTVDTTVPTVTIQQAVSQVDPASDSPIHFTVTFSEPVSDFNGGEVLLSGMAPGTLAATVTGSEATYDVAVSGMTGSGTVIASIAAGAAHDAAGNANAASSSTDNSVTYIHAPSAATVGLYDPVASTFYLRYANDWGNPDNVFQYAIGAGWAESPVPGSPPLPPAGPGPWKPFAGDWNGDGTDTIGLYDPATSWFHLRNSNSSGGHDICFAYGAPGSGWIPLVGDWDGNGTVTVGLFDPETSMFYLRNSLDTGSADVAFAYGAAHLPLGERWQPIVSDWDGNGTATVGFFDPYHSWFYLHNSNTTGFAEREFPYGAPGSNWMTVMADWNGDNGQSTMGFYLPDASHWYLSNSNEHIYADLSFGFGAAGAGWLPIVGNWDGPGGQALRAVGSGQMAVGGQQSAVSGQQSGILIPNPQSLIPLVSAAIARWTAAGASIATPQVVVTDLPGAELGRVQDGVIYLDRDAAGHGWFIDPTPAVDEEFAQLGDDNKLTAIHPQAVDKIDLLTVIEHELGHLSGLADLDAAAASLMSGSLPTGVRRG